MRTQGQCTRMEGPQLTKANPMLGIRRVFFGAKSVAKPPFLGDFSTIPKRPHQVPSGLGFFHRQIIYKWAIATWKIATE